MHKRWLEVRLEKISFPTKENRAPAVLNGNTCFLKSLTDWWIEWFSDSNLSAASERAFNTGNDWRAFGGRRMTSRSRKWRVFEAFGCFDTSLDVFVKKVGIGSVNFIVYRSWQHYNNHSSGNKPYYMSSKYAPRQDMGTRVCRLISIHTQHNF